MKKYALYILLLSIIILATMLGGCAKSTPAGADEQALYEKHRDSFEYLSDLISKYFQQNQTETNDGKLLLYFDKDPIQLRDGITDKIITTDNDIAVLQDITEFFSGMNDSIMRRVVVTNEKISYDAGKVIVFDSFNGDAPKYGTSTDDKLDSKFVYQLDKHWYYTYGADFGPRALAWFNDPLYQFLLFLLQPVTIIAIVCIIAAIVVLATVRRKRKKQMKALGDDSKASKP